VQPDAAGGRRQRAYPSDMEPRCSVCHHEGAHTPGSPADGPFCERCDRCWVERQDRDRPPHHGER